MVEEENKYNHQAIEPKWQRRWEEAGLYQAKDNSLRPNFYCLIEFPYPSSDGLHVGHPRSYTALDILARKKRMEGYNVLFPIGFDAFGLPTENYAIKVKKNPAEITETNVDRFRRQLKSLGLSFDWSREVITTDPQYYKWTQWIFLQLYKAGLVYQKEMPINWCPSCKIGLANEEVVGGNCERCGTPVTKKNLKQWLFKITKYAQRLIDDLEKVDYLEKIKTQQVNWIGRSEGALIKFEIRNSKFETNSKSEIPNSKHYVEVFTTRPDTLFGATYMVVSPEHELVTDILGQIANRREVEDYVKKAKAKSDLERTDLAKEKTGVELKGIKVINPVNQKEIPIWVADYVLMGYGTGAIMAVPAHDKRDFEFAKLKNLKIICVVDPGNTENINPANTFKYPFRKKIEKPGKPVLYTTGDVGYKWDAEKIYKEILNGETCYEGNGIAINSNQFNELKTEEFKAKITKWLEKERVGKKAVNYKLRDWIFSRQHYWGEPIPLVHCEECKKNNKPIVWIIHGSPSRNKSQDQGYTGEENQHWIPWLKESLEAKGVVVYNPRMPKAWQPDYQEWKKAVEKLEINENSVLIGHSAGGAFLPRWLGETKKRINKLILVVPGKVANEDNKRLHHFYDFKIDQTIKERVNEIIIFISDNEKDYRKKSSKIYSKLLGGRLITIKGTGHFTFEDMKTKEFPELLDEISFLPVGVIPVPEKDLPVELPKVKNYEPTNTGESPLAAIKDWVDVKCPQCGGKGKRETDTMPNWAGSNWYFIRYTDPRNDKEFASKKNMKHWLPVDIYNGGMEHTTLHLLYSRFWYKALYDLKLVPGPEPYSKRISHGMVLAEDGKKMSKSLGNVINPDEVVKEYGADTMRMYEMFMGPFSEAIPWDTKGIVGVRRFLDKICKLKVQNLKLKTTAQNSKLESLLHKTIKKVTEDIENFRFNTAVSTLMELANAMEKQKELPLTHYKILVTLLSPFAPHLSEELWEKLGHKESIFKEEWPKHDPDLAKESEVEFVIQVNGKVRDKMQLPADISEEEAISKAEQSKKIKKHLSGKQVVKKIFVPGKLLNIVIR
ncbi:MAG: leucine--tRNA ligase [Candidatus Kerfeldbacteria bacterium CG08_land_8_20_14_0_20_40_16]|uniref:Leucine--tRNA ligase n=1 Tax=Candidatus Kerfeldbacteria bacterium CG08_land_8_20_14_0_20_40_16 TaxID=2014244 RepID=A0A2H0YVC0_9BACT|nr:MAG: leucine--tRNA ligase [Candidatus Kerfeldbacteria bacterium CG08_land_8_20_14_0_20_40_16]